MTDDFPPPRPPTGYDRTQATAGIVHIGIGGFHRAHMAKYVHDLMKRSPGALRWGIVAAGLRDGDRALIDALNAQDGLYTLVERDGSSERHEVIGSILRVIDASSSSAALIAAAADPAVRIISLTVTEHGYCLDRATKRLDAAHPAIVGDLAAPDEPRSAIGVVATILAARARHGRGGLTMLSCDNIQHNGDVLRSAVADFVAMSDPSLQPWIDAEVDFPNAMVDRITPQLTPAVVAALRRRFEVDDAAPLVAEPFRQWVIEDRFRAGRPALDQVGVQFVADVAPYERMKLRLLNASHLALSGPAELMGLVSIEEAIGDVRLRRFVAALMDRETGPTIGPVAGADLDAYKRSVLDRFANPAIPDTAARVNADAPLNYLLDPIRDRRRDGLPIDLLGLALAAWLRRVRGEDDRGRPIAVVHPLADELRSRAVAGGADPRPLLGMTALFGALGDDGEVQRVVGDWLARLYEHGTARVLDEAVASESI